MEYDVIVAGAGPAGSTTARECALRGMRVLMLDRAEFPRDKPCGGGVNMRTAQLLPFTVDEVTERTIHGMQISVRAGMSYTRRSEFPLSFMTQRRRLDAFLADQAVQTGVTFRERAPLREVETDGVWVTVKAGNERVRARALVGADGANGTAARLSGIPVRRSLGIALEGNVSTANGEVERWSDTIAVDVGGSPGGYGWLFPKGDHVNIGVGGTWPVGPSLRDRLLRLTRYYGFTPGALWGVNGHPLPVCRKGSVVQRGNVILVGDAAGFVDPLTGEGIFAAVKSGQIAARHLSAYASGATSDLAGYAVEIEEELVPDLLVSIQLHEIFHIAPPIAAEMVKRSSRMWRLVCDLLTGQIGYASVKERSEVLAHAIDIVSAAGRLKARLAPAQ